MLQGQRVVSAHHPQKTLSAIFTALEGSDKIEVGTLGRNRRYTSKFDRIGHFQPYQLPQFDSNEQPQS